MSKKTALVLPCTLLFLLFACKKEVSSPDQTEELNQKQGSINARPPGSGTPAISWQTVYDGTSFSDYASLEASWNYLYPWGSDHNGTARMYASPTDHSQVYIETPGVLTIKATPCSPEGNSSADPHLPIRYHSGAIHGKQQVVINEQFPAWELSGDFKAPTTLGTWPAFWATGAFSWPPETDILEFKGNTTNWSNTADGPDWTNVSWETTKTVIPDAATVWHNYKVVMYRKKNKNGTWSNNVTCEYYIDGTKVGTHTGNNFFNQTFNIIINLQMEGSSGTPGPTGDTYYYAKNIVVRKGVFL